MLIIFVIVCVPCVPYKDTSSLYINTLIKKKEKVYKHICLLFNQEYWVLLEYILQTSVSGMVRFYGIHGSSNRVEILDLIYFAINYLKREVN